MSSKNNKRFYTNKDVYRIFKINNNKFGRNNKFLENYYNGNNDATINFDNDNSFNKINKKLKNLSNKNYNNILSDSKEPCTSKKK